MSTRVARYRGVDRRGVGRTGSIADGELARFVESCYRGGWKSLVAMVGEEQVAGIGPIGTSGARQWWARSAGAE